MRKVEFGSPGAGRYKPPRTGETENASEMQTPVNHVFVIRGRLGERRDGDSNPGYGFDPV